MSFALKHRQTGGGSVEAWGAGLGYEYDARHGELAVLHADSGKPLFHLGLEDSLRQHVIDYISLIEKTLQIKALVYSNNKTNTITHVVEPARLHAIIRMATQTAAMCLDLTHREFELFSEKFCALYKIDAIEIHEIDKGPDTNSLFMGTVTGDHGNTAKASASSLSMLIRHLSENVISGLVTVAYSQNSRNQAQLLLLAASALANMSRILDPRFLPARHIVGASNQNIYAANTGLGDSAH